MQATEKIYEIIEQSGTLPTKTVLRFSYVYAMGRLWALWYLHKQVAFRYF